jgi:hypothetical protein
MVTVAAEDLVVASLLRRKLLLEFNSIFNHHFVRQREEPVSNGCHPLIIPDDGKERNK